MWVWQHTYFPRVNEKETSHSLRNQTCLKINPDWLFRICRSRCEYYLFCVTRDCINLSLYNSDTRFFFLYSNVTIGGWIGCASCHTNLCRYVNPSHSWNTLGDAYITRKFSRSNIFIILSIP